METTTIAFGQLVDEAKRNCEEISKQNKLRRRRFLLKFLLVGFLIGRDVDKRIATLKARNKQIVDELLSVFRDLLEKTAHVNEFLAFHTHLATLQRRIGTFEEELGIKKQLILDIREEVEECHRSAR